MPKVRVDGVEIEVPQGSVWGRRALGIGLAGALLTPSIAKACIPPLAEPVYQWSRCAVRVLQRTGNGRMRNQLRNDEPPGERWQTVLRTRIEPTCGAYAAAVRRTQVWARRTHPADYNLPVAPNDAIAFYDPTDRVRYAQSHC